MQRDDLRVAEAVPPPFGAWEVSRPVSDAEVLEAIGATREWWCEIPEVGGPCYEGWDAGHPYYEKRHEPCRWVWIVEEDR